MKLFDERVSSRENYGLKYAVYRMASSSFTPPPPPLQKRCCAPVLMTFKGKILGDTGEGYCFSIIGFAQYSQRFIYAENHKKKKLFEILTNNNLNQIF